MKLAIAIIAILLASPAAAQQHQQHGSQPYSGLQQRPIKALSEQQLADLKAGRGMGLALAAELNGYPGPMHILELADRLGLTTAERQHFQQLFESMKAEAVAVGEKLIASELALDRQFANGSITAEILASLTHQIGQAQGELRSVHLKYHLASAELLTADQRRRYAQLRGYH